MSDTEVQPGALVPHPNPIRERARRAVREMSDLKRVANPGSCADVAIEACISALKEKLDDLDTPDPLEAGYALAIIELGEMGLA